MEKKVYRKVTAHELREVVRMAADEWMRYKQIAEVLGTSEGWVGNVIAYYDLSKEIRESRLLQLYEYLKTHTYLQARARYRCSGDFCSKAKRFGLREEILKPKPKPITKVGQPTREERIRAIKESLQRIQELKRRKA